MKLKAFYSLAFIACIFMFGSCKNDLAKESSSEIVKSEITSSEVKSLPTSEKPTEKAVGLDWYGMGDAEALVAKEKKNIIVDVYTQWCGPCKMMDKNTFTNPEVQKAMSEKFHAIKYDAEGNFDMTFKGKTYGNPNHQPNKRGRNSKHEFADFFSVRGYPSMVVMDENFNILEKIVGYKDPTQFLEAIKAY